MITGARALLILLALLSLALVVAILTGYSQQPGTLLALGAPKPVVTRRFSESSAPPASDCGGATRFKSWENGVVTAISSRIQRNCSKLFSGDKAEISKVKSQLKNWKNSVGDEGVLENSTNCSWVRDYFTDNLYTTRLERSFPIAFTYVIYNSPQQILRLLRFHYRQHNVYCVHPDKKSPRTFSNIFRNIAACLDNVIIPKELISVVWGTESILDAQMTCFDELMKFRKKQAMREKWKYILNICGKELPLTTTHGIVERLTKLKGSSSIIASKLDSHTTYKRIKGKIPFGLTGYKSMTYMALSFRFVNFLFTNQTAISLYNFFRGCRKSEEQYYATVYKIPGVPGGYDPALSKLYFNVDSYFWMYDQDRPCGGKKVHGICIVSVAELEEILRVSDGFKKSLFHNKYFMEVDYVVMDCLEERLVTRNRKEYKHDCIR